MAPNRALSTPEAQRLVASASDLWLPVKVYLQYVTEMGSRERVGFIKSSLSQLTVSVLRIEIV